MNIIIIGGFGFLGFRVAEFFQSKKNKIILTTSRKTKINNYKKKYEILYLSYKNYEELLKIKINIDILIYCSGIGSTDSERNYKLAKEINCNMANDIGKIAIKLGIKQFIYFSTIHTYDKNLSKNYNEKCQPLNNHPYAKTNILAEQKLKKLSNKSNKTNFIILRISNAFGYPITTKSNSWSLLLNDMVRNLVKNKYFKINSAGNQKRDFISVTELCYIINFIIKKKSKNTKNYNVFNASSGVSMTIREVSFKIKKFLESIINEKLRIEFEQKKVQKNSLNFKLSNKKLIKYGYNFKISFNSEIKKLYLFCKKNKI